MTWAPISLQVKEIGNIIIHTSDAITTPCMMPGSKNSLWELGDHTLSYMSIQTLRLPLNLIPALVAHQQLEIMKLTYHVSNQYIVTSSLAFICLIPSILPSFQRRLSVRKWYVWQVVVAFVHILFMIILGDYNNLSHDTLLHHRDWQFCKICLEFRINEHAAQYLKDIIIQNSWLVNSDSKGI